MKIRRSSAWSLAEAESRMTKVKHFRESVLAIKRTLHVCLITCAEFLFRQALEPCQVLPDKVVGCDHNDRRLPQRFPLRTYDAIHLASAREARRMLRGLFEGEVHFLAFDAYLLKAARNTGFTVPS